jgi:hypothetical protein
MKKNRKLLGVALIIIAVVIIFSRSRESREATKVGQGTVESLFAEPGPTLKSKVDPVTSALADNPYAEDMAYFYRRVGIAIKTADTTAQAREINIEMGKILLETSPYTAYQPKLQPVVEELLDEMVGKATRRLEEEDRRQLQDLFNAIAWACLRAAGKAKSVAVSDLDDIQFQYVASYDSDGWDLSKNAMMSPSMEYHETTEDEESDLDRLPFLKRLYGAGPTARGPPQENDDKPGPTGLIVDEAEYADYLKSDKPLFSDLGFMGSGTGKKRLLYRAVQKLCPNAYTEKQTTGDCTSHGTRNAADCSRAYEILVLKEPEAWVEQGATEAIYGYRGHSGEGMSVYRAVKFVNEVGGIAVRKKYGAIDLSEYNSRIGTNWGRTSTPQSLVRILSDNQISHAALVRDVYEARDAIVGGFGLTVGSDVGFSSIRDRNGFSDPKGSWMHCMAWVGTAPESDLIPGSNSDEPCFLIANSWGPWNGGPKGKYRIPDGSFWITSDVASRMIKQRQAFAIGNFEGFPPKPLADWGFEYLGLSPDSENDLLPSVGSGIVAQAVATVKYRTTADITAPKTGDNVDSDNDGGVDENCSRCNNSGYITHGDGHRSVCPNPRCPTKRRSNEAVNRNDSGARVRRDRLSQQRFAYAARTDRSLQLSG